MSIFNNREEMSYMRYKTVDIVKDTLDLLKDEDGLRYWREKLVFDTKEMLDKQVELEETNSKFEYNTGKLVGALTVLGLQIITCLVIIGIKHLC